MKKAVLLCIVFLLLSCDDGGMKKPVNPLLGTWEYEVIDENWEFNGSRYFTRYTFHNDTEFTLTVEHYSGTPITLFQGTYTHDDEYFYFNCTRDSDGRVFTNVKSYYELDRDTLHIGTITTPISSPDDPLLQYYLYPYIKKAD